MMIAEFGRCKKCPTGAYGPPTHKADVKGEVLVHRCVTCGHVDSRPVQTDEGNSFMGAHQPTRRRR